MTETTNELFDYDTLNNDELALIPVLSDSPEEQEKRQREAEEHGRKLQWIQDNVPSRVYNVCGSSAGAGSGDFHMYRMIRRREQTRLRRIEEEARKQKQMEDFVRENEEKRRMDEERTAKRRRKRQREKEKKKRGKLQKIIGKDILSEEEIDLINEKNKIIEIEDVDID